MKKLVARVCYPDRTLHLAPLAQRDFPGVLALYQTVAITADNCRTRLSADHPHSFRWVGGMFQIQDRTALERTLDAGSGYSLVARQAHGAVAGFFYDAFTPPAPALPEAILGHSGGPVVRPEIAQAMQAGALHHGGEIIIAENCGVPHLPLVIFRAYFDMLLGQGYRVYLGEVYLVSAYRLDGRLYRIGLLNERSLGMCEGLLGGRPIGGLPERRIPLPGLEVWVRPQVLYWNIPEARAAITERLRLEGIRYQSPNPQEGGKAP